MPGTLISRLFSVNRECTASTHSCSMRGFWCSSVLIAGHRYCKVADVQVQSCRWSFDNSNVGVVSGHSPKDSKGPHATAFGKSFSMSPSYFWKFPFLSWPWRLPVSIGFKFKAVWQQLGVQVLKITRSPSAGCPKQVMACLSSRCVFLGVSTAGSRVQV